MSTNQATFSGLLQNIVSNVEDIVALEVRLALTEVKQEAREATRASVVLGTSIVFALYAFGFLMLCVMFLLRLAMPQWTAALLVAVLLAIPASILAASGLKKIRSLHGPERTVESLKEDVQWAKHLGK